MAPALHSARSAVVEPAIYRIDRFAVRASFDVPTGTPIAQRMGRMEVHVIDLTDTNAMAAAAKERTSEVTTAQPATIY